MGGHDMPRKRQVLKRKHRKEAVPFLGAVGMSLSLAGGASAATAGAAEVPHIPSQDTTLPQITLNEEEISDVSLGTFYVFDKETAGTPRLGQQLARGCGGCHGGGGGPGPGGAPGLGGRQGRPGLWPRLRRLRLRRLRLRRLRLLLAVGSLPRLLVA